MIDLSTFQEHLSFTEPLSSLPNRSVNSQASDLPARLINLSAQTQTQQVEQLTKVLATLRVATLNEQQCLKLTGTVIQVSDRLIATLRQHYIYETGALSAAQLVQLAQVKSLYYSIILVYDRFILCESTLSGNPHKFPTSTGWQRYFNSEASSSIPFAIAVYQTLRMYQKLLGEDALCYQSPSPDLWFKINQLYYLARQQNIADTDLSIHTVTQRANSIHRLYCQICLHNLLNVRAMSRSNMLLVQRLLPEWAEHIVATIEPQTETRVFVDLHSNKPPIYLTANSDINPYEEGYECLFIELAPMVEYLQSRRLTLIDEGSDGGELYLLSRISMTITYRYLQPPLTLPNKYSIQKDAVLVTGFNDIHDRINPSRSFASLIAAKMLSDAERPRYDTSGKKQISSDVLSTEIYNSKEASSSFRTLRLSPKTEHLLVAETGASQATSTAAEPSDTTDEGAMMTAPPPLYIMSLILVCRSESDWSMGIVRWLNLDTETPEAEWQILGHQLVACGLRLEGKNGRSQHFVPAFILGSDDQLQTTGTLIVPTPYFKTHDRVIMRIDNKQTSLRLGQRLLVTDECSQYEVVQL